MDKLSLSVAIKKHLSIPGEKIGDIIRNIKSLDDNDKAWLKARFIKEGICDIM